MIFVSVTHFILSRYLRQKPSLTVEGFAAEKKYFYIRSLYTTLMLVFTLGVLITANLIFPGKLEYVTSSPALLVVLMPFIRKKIKKYKPAHLDEY